MSCDINGVYTHEKRGVTMLRKAIMAVLIVAVAGLAGSSQGLAAPTPRHTWGTATICRSLYQYSGFQNAGACVSGSVSSSPLAPPVKPPAPDPQLVCESLGGTFGPSTQTGTQVRLWSCEFVDPVNMDDRRYLQEVMSALCYATPGHILYGGFLTNQFRPWEYDPHFQCYVVSLG